MKKITEVKAVEGIELKPKTYEELKKTIKALDMKKGHIYIVRDLYNPRKSWEIRKTYSGAYLVGQRISGKIFKVCGKSYHRTTFTSILERGFTQGELIDSYSFQEEKEREEKERLKAIGTVKYHGLKLDVLAKDRNLYLFRGWTKKAPYLVVDGINLLKGTEKYKKHYEHEAEAWEDFKSKKEIKRRVL